MRHITRTEMRNMLAAFMAEHGPRETIEALAAEFEVNAARHAYSGDSIASAVSLKQCAMTRRLAKELPMK